MYLNQYLLLNKHGRAIIFSIKSKTKTKNQGTTEEKLFQGFFEHSKS